MGRRRDVETENGSVLADAIGGGTLPLSVQISPTACTQTSGTFTISSSDYTKPVIVIGPTGGSLTGDLTVVFPNTNGAKSGSILSSPLFMLDISALDLAGHNLILKNAGGASFTISSLSANIDIVMVLINARGANTITVRA